MIHNRGMEATNEQLAKEVLAQMHEGASLRTSCRIAGVPASTFLTWVSKDSSLAEQYAHAREMLIENMAEDLLQISDEPVQPNAMGSTDSGAVAKQRLQVDTRKWLLSKLAPKKYGDKVEHDLKSSDGSMTPTQPVYRIVKE